jgi:hypothetical protein
MVSFGAATINELIAKKNYAKAIEAIKAQLKAGKHNPQLHIQLADVLLLAKKEKEAIQILLRVSEEFAHEGFEAKAIAVLKKIDRLEPGRKDVQSKLSSLVKRPSAPVAAPGARGGGGGASFEIGMEEIGFEPPPGAGGGVSVPAPAPPPRRAPELELPSFATASEPSIDLGLDAAPSLDLGLDARPAPPPPPARPAPAPVQDLDFGTDEDEEPAPAILLEPVDEGAVVDDIQVEPEILPELEPDNAPTAEGGFDDLFTQELMGAIDEAFQFAGGEAAAAEAQPTVVRGDFMSSPLFKGFAPDELVAILQGLTLHAFDAGDIILAQGAPGQSMYILTTGTVKAWVKDEYGSYRYIRDLEEGSFFGEVAILTGQPRTATITAATRCELLELDRGTLDAISIAHPHVQQVLQEFYQERMSGRA